MVPLQMEKTLWQKPNAPVLYEHMHLRVFREFPNPASWLEIRKRAFANQIKTSRDWTERDFHREFTTNAHWNEDNLAFLFCNGKPVGSVYLSALESDGDDHGTLNWLMVIPEQRRRGCGRLLVEWSVSQAWRQSIRRLKLTTLPNWESAILCYRSCGFVPKNESTDSK